MQVRRLIEESEQQCMDETKYQGMHNDHENRFDYGDREIITNGYRES